MGTSGGHEQGEFKTTRWATVHKACHDDSPSGHQALADLCLDYWYPLYAFARRQGHSHEDAQDLTQAFFARLLEKDHLKRAEPARGRFRTFLLSAFNNFVINDWQKNHAAIRGGKFAFVSWDALEAEERYAHEPLHQCSPEVLYDQRWADTLLKKTMEHLRQEYATAGNAPVFEGLQGFLTRSPEQESYKALATRFNLSEDAVKMRVHRLRQRFGQLLRVQIADTVAEETEIDDEMRHLFAVWS